LGETGEQEKDMKQPRINRRQFFKLSAFSAAAAVGLPAISLASIAAAPSREAMAATEQPHAPAIPQPTFNPISSNTTFGALTDISMGWDGTLWGIDGQGAPHIYDEINKVWAPHGDGIDAALGALDSSGTTYVFKGNQVIQINAATMQAGAPQTIDSLWPNLPDSFKLGVVGASWTSLGSALVLYNGGRFVATDGSIPSTKLTDLPGWPQTPNWKDGVIDGVITIATGLNEAYLIRNGEMLYINPVNKTVLDAPRPLQLDWWGDPDVLPASWVTSLNAATRINGSVDWFFSGTSVAPLIPFSSSGQIQYIGAAITNWPATWHPVLAHAPNGRDGNLWCATTAAQNKVVVRHNGDAWASLSQPADHVGVGEDNTVMLASANQLWKFNGATFDAVSPASNLIQVSLGNANAVFARDSAGNVYSFDGSTGTLTKNTAVGAVSHIATTSDGSLWHAKPANAGPDAANMHRLIVGAGAPTESITVKQSLVSAVTKVAGTGFGAAHCLAQDTQGVVQAYRYDSPYLFKTAKRYVAGCSRVERGLGMLYIIDTAYVGTDTDPEFDTSVVALDAHTGAEIARTAPIKTPLGYGQPVFDPIQEVIYVATSIGAGDDYDNTTQGQLIALDARTLAVKWSFTAPTGIDAEPGVNGKNLIISDRAGTIYMFDTAQALQNPGAVTPRWTVSAAGGGTQTHRVSAPAFVGDQFYVAVWDANGVDSDGNFFASIAWASYKTSSGTSTGRGALRSANVFMLSTHLFAPVLGQLNVTPNAAETLAPAIFYNCDDTVVAVSIDSNPVTRSFSMPAVSIYAQTISSGFAYDNDANNLWFGTLYGALVCLDVNMKPANYTPFVPVQNFSIASTPVIYKDAQGGTTVFFGAYYQIVPFQDAQEYYLRGFDPQNGNMAILPLGATRVRSMSSSVTNGTLYVAGFDSIDSTVPAGQYSQVWALRVDNLVQAARDFVIESQLMQEPDQSAAGSGNIPADPNAPLPDNPIPPSRARYRTQITIVDDQKTPQPYEAVKVWSDIDGTVITVSGKPYTIGTGDSACALLQTGVDGSLALTVEANDANAPALRVWAAFMDSYERIVVYPDQEWQQRVAKSHSDSTADPNKAPDPSRPNLNTVHNYKNTQLFTDAEKNQQPQSVPQIVATGISTMSSRLGYGSSGQATVANALKSVQASSATAPYIAYTTLTGMHYLPNNARATRKATINAPFGLQLSKPTGGAQTLTTMTHSEARNTIDTLVAAAPAANVKRVHLRALSTQDAFGDFWSNLLQGLVTGIEHVIVSVADGIMFALKYTIGGGNPNWLVVVVDALRDIGRVIMAFFAMIEKAIEDVIEALSVLFHFGEIMWTHRWLAGQMATYKETLKTTMTNTCKDAIDKFIGEGETAIAGWIDQVKKSLNPQQTFGTMHSMGSTTHTAMSAQLGSAGNSATGNSQAVQGNWGVQHMKDGMSNGVNGGNSTFMAAASSIQPQQAGDDAVNSFLSNFIQSLTNPCSATDPNAPCLSKAFNDLQDDFSRLVSPSSAQQFLTTLVDTLLDLIKDLLIGALMIGQALFDGLIGIIGAVVDAIWSALTTPWDIPIISWLYKLLFKEDLNLLNLVTLVVAIPVTIIYRVAAGEYPQDSNSTYLAQMRRQGMSPQQVDSGILPDWAQKMMGTTVAILNLVYGVVNAFLDFIYPVIRDGFAHGFDFVVKVATYVSVGIGLVIQVLSIPIFTNDAGDISRQDWGVFGISVAIAVGAIVGTPAVDLDEPGSIMLGSIMSFVSVLLIAVAVSAFVADGKTDVNTDLGFAANIIGTVPVIINPLKFLKGTLGSIGGSVDAVVDGVAGLALCALILTTTWRSQPSTLTRQRRLFFPFLAVDSGRPRAIPLAGGLTP
jgi:hypothetical protein